MRKKFSAIVLVLLIPLLVWHFLPSNPPVEDSSFATDQKIELVQPFPQHEIESVSQDTVPESTELVTEDKAPSVLAKASALCLFVKDNTDQRFMAFNRRYSYLGFSDAELRDYVELIRRNDLLNGPLQNEALIDKQQHERHQQNISRQGESDTSDKMARQRAADQMLRDSYQLQEGKFYDYNHQQFLRAVLEFVQSYRDEADIALPMLYLHFKAAQRHYWRNARHPDWRIFAGLEQHRQALIYWLLVYGNERDVRTLYEDRFMLSTVNQHTGEIDRGYGGVLTPRVQDAIEFYRENFNFDALQREARTEPVNFTDGDVTDYLPVDNSEVGHYIEKMRQSNMAKSYSELTQALGRECQI